MGSKWICPFISHPFTEQMVLCQALGWKSHPEGANPWSVWKESEDSGGGTRGLGQEEDQGVRQRRVSGWSDGVLSFVGEGCW